MSVRFVRITLAAAALTAAGAIGCSDNSKKHSSTTSTVSRPTDPATQRRNDMLARGDEQIAEGQAMKQKGMQTNDQAMVKQGQQLIDDGKATKSRAMMMK